MYTPFSSLLLLIAVTFLATWSLRQKPGFEEVFDDEEGVIIYAPIFFINSTSLILRKPELAKIKIRY